MHHLFIVVIIAVLVFGVGTLFWTIVGASRLVIERINLFLYGYRRRSYLPAFHGNRFIPADVAIMSPAHNEEACLAYTLQSAVALLPRSNIHVISDGSTDDTVAIAERWGVQVLDLNPNRGKAKAISDAIEHYQLARRFKVMLLVDADTRLNPDYLETGLPLFDDPEIVAVAGWARGLWDPPPRTLLGRFLVSYRSRLYAVTQCLVKLGQAAKHASCVTIVPGFASMYRTDVLKEINITAPGLVIEDFNMTFELHRKKLGRIAFLPFCAVAYTQDPDTLADYYKQIQRWTLGYWQTVRLHGLRHWGKFWTMLTVQVIELTTWATMLLTMPFILLFSIYSQTLANTFGDPTLFDHPVVGWLTPYYVALGFLIPDMALTVIAAIVLKRPYMLLMAPLFPIMRFVEAWVALRAIPPSRWRTQDTGQWKSPTRRGSSVAPERDHLHAVDGDAVA